MSLDGFISKKNNKEMEILSSRGEIKYRNTIRDEVDAVLIGGNTLREDQPRISLSRADQCKVVLSRSGEVSTNGFFFDTTHVVHLYTSSRSVFDFNRNSRENVKIHLLKQSEFKLITLLYDMKTKRSINRVLVEGGAYTVSNFIKNRLFDDLYLGIVPIFYGSMGGKRAFMTSDCFNIQRSNQLRIIRQFNVENTSIIHMRQR